MALKFLDDTGGGRTSDAVKSMNYAVAMGAKMPGEKVAFSEFFWLFPLLLVNIFHVVWLFLVVC